ncbi:F-box-like protein [Rhizoctonia solani 123E]|uniref:F-box-like protein n=1 Tax=Rhizoctonia solani 123E TaxID=1423351 RepID=A0A074RL43_9AGAM|nr:F-box-like protein [Rhizoctonia solani 123E]
MAGPTLPNEILAGVFGHLSPSCLAVASRVSRTWKTVAFPPLYQTVYLCLGTHLEQFVQRILAEEVGALSSITAHLKGLVLDIEYRKNRQAEMIRKFDLDKLNAVIPRLTQLSSLSWNLMFVPEDPETFELFRSQCPKLDSVHIWIKGDIDFYSDQYDTLFDFKNLSHFSLTIRNMPPSFDEDLLDPLTSLLDRCPQLSSLVLDIHNSEFKYSPATLVAALDDEHVFPLRRFYMRGCEDPDWMEFFENPESHPFRQFLRRHKGIEDLALGYFDETAHWKHIDPTEISQLFPVLKQFEGPAFLFKPLVLSALAGRVEKLVIVDKELRDEFSLTEIYNRNPSLPRLRKFGIWAKEIEEGILVNMLRTIVNGASGLEEIEIHPEIDSTNYGDVMKSITQIRGLRSVTLDDSILGAAAENDGKELEWDAFAEIIRRVCPRLQTIYRPIEKFDKENREKVWELKDGT